MKKFTRAQKRILKWAYNVGSIYAAPSHPPVRALLKLGLIEALPSNCYRLTDAGTKSAEVIR